MWAVESKEMYLLLRGDREQLKNHCLAKVALPSTWVLGNQVYNLPTQVT